MVHFLGRTVRQLRRRPIINIQLKKTSGKVRRLSTTEGSLQWFPNQQLATYSAS